MRNLLSKVCKEDIQNIYECISQAIGDDRIETSAHLSLRTHISDPFLSWDLIYRNLMNKYDNGKLKYSATKRGMWTVLLLYDENSKLVFSFMRENRFKDIKNQNKAFRPKYIQALLSLNACELAPKKQEQFFIEESKTNQSKLEIALDELCANFEGKIDTINSRHVMVVFSSNNGSVDSLKGYLLDKDLDIVLEEDWLNYTKPIMSSMPDIIQSQENEITPTLKPKALNRIHEKKLVKIKSQEGSKEA